MSPEEGTAMDHQQARDEIMAFLKAQAEEQTRQSDADPGKA